MIGISQITNAIKNSLTTSFRTPANVLSSIVMLCAMVKRPGLSCMLSTTNVIQNLAKHGIPTEPLPDGSQNLMNILVSDIICETFRALKEDANIQVALPPGAFTVKIEGFSSAGPFSGTGVPITPSSGGVGCLQ